MLCLYTAWITAYSPCGVCQEFQRLAVHPHAPQSTITAILHDTRGFLWFADEQGLHRYDGRSFVWYRINSDRTSTDNTLVALCQDSSGTLWLANTHSLYRFDRRQEQILLHSYTSSSSSRIITIIADSAGSVWVIRENAIEHIASGKRFPHSHSHITAAIMSMHRMIWLGTDSGVEVFNPQNGQITAHTLPPATRASRPRNTQPREEVRALVELTDAATILVGTRSGMLVSIKYHQKPKLVLHGKHLILGLHCERSGQIWCATAGGGLLSLHTSELHAPQPRFHSVGSGRFFTSIAEDRQGILWLGSTDGSIYKLDRSVRKFLPFKPDISKILGKNATFLTLALWEDSRRNIWLGTEHGLLRYTPHTGAWKLFQHTKHDKTSLSSNTVSCIYEDRFGTLWIGTTAGGLHSFNPATEKFHAFRHNPKDSTSISSDNISCIYEDRRGRLWIGTWINGLNLFDRATQTCTHYRSTPENISTLSSNSISIIAEDCVVGDGTLWVGTYEDGLNAFHPTIQAFTRHHHNPSNPRTLSSNAVSGICELPDGTLWITTDVGLDKFDRRTQTFTRYTVEHGLPREPISAVVGDSQGNLWIMGATTITKFTPRTEQAHTYDISDGLGTILPNNELEPEQFSSRAYCRGRDGSIYFGISGGFVRFHPDSVRDNPHVPPIVLTALKKFNVPVALPISITETDVVELSYTDTFISLEFAALTFSAPEKNRYRYKLEGFDTTWIDAGTRNEAVYTNLSGGEYTFRVIACNNDGVWNTAGCTLTIIVHPPFWQTRWFYALSIVLVVSGAWGGFRWRVRRLRARNEELQRLVDERTKQLRTSLHDLEEQKHRTEEHAREVERLNAVLNAHNADLAEQTRKAQLEMLRYQLNPHFLFNALISISDLVQEDSNLAVKMLHTLMEYLRYALQPSGLPIVPLAEEIHAVQSYLAIEKIRFEDRLIVTIDIQPEAHNFYVPSFMLQPLVENAIKYGMRTSPMPLKIDIHASLCMQSTGEEALVLEVRNSGSLHIPEHTNKPAGTGTGLRNIRERLDVLFPCKHTMSLTEHDGYVQVHVILEGQPHMTAIYHRER